MKRRQLSLKQPSALEKARKIAASDPDTIYGFYDALEMVINDLNINDRPECVWNIDESNLFLEAQRSKVIAPKGKKASRTTATSGREAVTVMAGISADQTVLPPFIVFKGKYLMSGWYTPHSYPGTTMTATESGWMTSEAFFNWFVKFCTTVNQRPLLIIMDGHNTHVTYQVIQHAREQDVTLLHLPPHTTDRLQPLDVCCFKALKARWDKAIAKWTTKNRAKRISRPEFVELTGKTILLSYFT